MISLDSWIWWRARRLMQLIQIYRIRIGRKENKCIHIIQVSLRDLPRRRSSSSMLKSNFNPRWCNRDSNPKWCNKGSNPFHNNVFLKLLLNNKISSSTRSHNNRNQLSWMPSSKLFNNLTKNNNLKHRLMMFNSRCKIWRLNKNKLKG